MLYKVIGGTFIITGTSLWGFFVSGTLFKRYKSLVKISSALSVMENEICYSNEPIDTVLKNAVYAVGLEPFFLRILENEDKTIRQRWEEAVISLKRNSGLKDSDCELLRIFSLKLGMSGRDSQIKNINHIKTLLARNIDEAYKNHNKLGKMYKGLGITAGLFIAVILM